jgi:hypothetical protein
MRRFGGDPNVVGRKVRVSGAAVPIEIAGVMPEGFVFPYRSMLGPSGFTRASQPDVWLPLTRGGTEGRLVDASGQPNRNIHFLAVIGRLAPGVTREDAARAATALAQQREQEFPDTNAGWGVTVRPLHEQTVGALRPALLTLLFGVGVVLLITCINVANVLLSRAAGHRRVSRSRGARRVTRASRSRRWSRPPCSRSPAAPPVWV